MIGTIKDIITLKNKKYSLRKTVNIVVIVGYCSLLILLGILNYYLIENYQIQRRKQEEMPLDKYIELVSEEMDKAKRLIYDIYVFDNNFSALSGTLGSAEKFSNAYDLRKSLESFMSVDENLHGFYIFYDKSEAPLYHINTEKISSSCASTIGNVLKSMFFLSEENQVTKWTAIDIEDGLYLIIPCNKGNVSVFCIINVTDAVNKISEYTTIPSDTVILHDGRIVGKSDEYKAELQRAAKENKGNSYFRYAGKSIYGARIPDTSVYVFQIYKAGIDSFLSSGQIVLLIFTALSILIAFWIVYNLRLNLILPLSELTRELYKIRNDENANIGDIPTCFEELEQVTDTLRTTIFKLEKQRLVSYENYIEKQKAQMQYLQIQMQPHFYLNGLKVISALIYSGDSNKAQSYILSLSEHMRDIMQIEAETTTLEKELEFTKNYVYLRNQMSQRVVELSVDASEETLKGMVPTLLIQTFVDNSIKHAKSGSLGAVLKIDVTICCLRADEETFLDVQIHDNGFGYDSAMLRLLEEEPKAGEKHIGISNLRRRCRLMYGDKAEFSFYNEDGAFSECIIPFRSDNDERSDN